MKIEIYENDAGFWNRTIHEQDKSEIDRTEIIANINAPVPLGLSIF